MKSSIRFSGVLLPLLLCFAATTAESGGKAARPPPPPPPANPPARAWHGFTGNGGTIAESSRLFMFGGASSSSTALDDLWFYRPDSASWTFVTPASRSRPGRRQWMGWSCGDGACVLANGSNGVGAVSETWVYTEATNAWASVNCRKTPCPSARQMVTTAFDQSARRHLLFGGRYDLTSFDDTWLFDGSTMSWQLVPRQSGWPAKRTRAAAIYVPGLGVVMHGGQDDHFQVQCDAFVWAGNGWTPFSATGLPCLHSHSMAWDERSQRLIIAGGYTDANDTANSRLHYLQFTGGVPARSWIADPDSSGCYAAVKPGSRMALDQATGRKVFFGGEANVSGVLTRYGDTSVCD